jgi:hypothetical protein
MSERHPKVAAVVLTYNDRENLLACLLSLRQVTYPNLWVIVSDNGSTDGSIEAVRSMFPEVTLLENGRNLFWAGGNNVGIELALAHGADWVLLLNNDIEVHPDFVTELVRAGESDPRVGVVGPKIYYHGDPKRLWYAGGKVHLWRGLVRHVGIREIDEGQYDERTETDYVTGCALMARREVFEKIGLIDPIYKAYAEDVDFCWRAKRAGFRIVYEPKAVLWHKVGGYWGVVTSRKIRQKLRSHFIFFRRYSPWLAWVTTIPIFQVWEVLRVGFAVATGRIERR